MGKDKLKKFGYCDLQQLTDTSKAIEPLIEQVSPPLLQIDCKHDYHGKRSVEIGFERLLSPSSEEQICVAFLLEHVHVFLLFWGHFESAGWWSCECQDVVLCQLRLNRC